LRFKLPLAKADSSYVGAGREFSKSGKTLTVFTDLDTCYIYAYDNSYSGDNGDKIIGNVRYSLA
jgi:hypothetical protein